MTLVANIFGRLRTAVMAAFVFALLTASMTAVHAMPCPDPLAASSVSLSDGAEIAAVHSEHDGGSKTADMSIDRCCQKSCAACVSVVPPVTGQSGLPTPPSHLLPAGAQSAGISVGPPHGPPRS